MTSIMYLCSKTTICISISRPYVLMPDRVENSLACERCNKFSADTGSLASDHKTQHNEWERGSGSSWPDYRYW